MFDSNSSCQCKYSFGWKATSAQDEEGRHYMLQILNFTTPKPEEKKKL
jgi:hypothetical protein